MNRGRRRRNQPRRRVANFRFGRAITRATHGIRINPSVDPPEYVSNPWWPITTTFSVDADSEIMASHLYLSVIAQLGFNEYLKGKDTIPIEMRLVSIRAWGLHKQPIQLAVFDHVGKKNRFTEISDYGSSVQYSRVGWRYGRIASYDALVKDDPDVLFDITGASKAKTILIYVQLLIRTANAPKPALFTTLPIDELTNSLSAVSVQ